MGTGVDIDRQAELNPILRVALLAFGWINVGLGFAGAFLPVLPTTPFLLVALWAFAQSSRRFHDWLYNHPKFGPTLRDWRDHRVVPVRAKALSLSMMATSLAYVTFFVAEDWRLPTSMACVMVPTAIWLVTRASSVQQEARPVEIKAES